MATEDDFLPPLSTAKSKSDDGEFLPPPSKSGLKSGAQQFARGAIEAIPFTGEKLAGQAGLPMPTTFPERLTRRAARNAPYAALGMATGVGAIPSALGFLGATGLGQIAEEVGVPESYQPVFEVAGGGAAQLGKDVAGRTLGYIQPELEALYKRAKKSGYEVGPGARTEAGMKYGAGSDPASNIRNLEKFTQEATGRAGNPSKVVNANWIQNTGDDLGREVENLFAGKVFSSKPFFTQNIQALVNEAESAFGQQGNVVKTIIEKNISGARAGGELISPRFKAEDLRKAIVEVNGALTGAKGNQANILHKLKDSLEELAASNLSGQAAKQYANWRTKYNSFATLRDLNQLEGKSGVTRAGQINPAKLLDVITNRTGGVATRSPLHLNLGEYGDIFRSKDVAPPGALKAAMQTITESPLSKALQTGIQPRAPSRAAGYGATAQTLSPLQQYMQASPSNE
jgi:hypothetical protein